MTEKSIQDKILSVQEDAIALAKHCDDKLSKFDLAVKFEKKTGISKLYLLGAAAFVIFVFLLSGLGPGLLIDLVGFVYPAYASFRAIKTTGKDDDTQWLTYWIIFAIFSLVEKFTDFAFSWLPLYFFFKLAFLLFCFLPQTNGAQFVFKNVVDPFLTKVVARIDLGFAPAAPKKSE